MFSRKVAIYIRLSVEDTKTIRQLSDFLCEHEIESIESIDKKLSDVELQLSEAIDMRQKDLQAIEYAKPHITDQLRSEIQKYTHDIHILETSLKNLYKQIELQKQLQEEFFYSSIKAKNLLVARDILGDVAFDKCPACGKEIILKESNVCCLCHQTPDDIALSNYAQIEIDLLERKKEISRTIEKMECKKILLEKQLSILLDKKTELDISLTIEQKEYDSLYLSNIKEIDTKIQSLKSDIRYWEKIRALPLKISELYNQLGRLEVAEKEKKDELNSAKQEADQQENQLNNLKVLFLDTLMKVKFPSIQKSDSVMMDTKSFYPRIITMDNDVFEVDFVKLSSGGKKTIFKACFAIALQRLLSTLDNDSIPFPNILIIDTPMKNISERENLDIFKGFYDFIYSIIQTEFKNTQIIIIDKEYYEPPKDFNISMISKHMTNDNPKYPGLIPYYSGH